MTLRDTHIDQPMDHNKPKTQAGILENINNCEKPYPHLALLERYAGTAFPLTLRTSYGLVIETDKEKIVGVRCEDHAPVNMDTLEFLSSDDENDDDYD